MSFFDIVSHDVFNKIIRYLDHNDIIAIYDVTRHLRLYDRNHCLRPLVQCIEIADTCHLSRYDYTILLNIALIKGMFGCIDYLFDSLANKKIGYQITSDNQENNIRRLYIDGALLRKTMTNLKMLPSSHDVPLDLHDTCIKYYASKIKKYIGEDTPFTNKLCFNILTNGFYTTYDVLCRELDYKLRYMPDARVITNKISTMDPVIMRMISLRRYLWSNPFGKFYDDTGITMLESFVTYPGGIPWLHWIEHTNNIKPIINESVLIFVENIYRGHVNDHLMYRIRRLQMLGGMFRKYNMSDNVCFSYGSDYPLDKLINVIDMGFLQKMETEIKIKRDINPIFYFSGGKTIDYEVMTYLDRNYNIVAMYVKVPNMSKIDKKIIVNRILLLFRHKYRCYKIILNLLIFAHKNGVGFVYMDNILANIDRLITRDAEVYNQIISLYIVNTAIYRHEIVTLGFDKSCCPAIGLKSFRQISFELDTV